VLRDARRDPLADAAPSRAPRIDARSAHRNGARLRRGVGEYGSVIFIAGNVPFVSEIAPLLIVVKLEEYDYAGANAIAAIMLALAFVMLLAINAAQAWTRRSLGHG